MENFYSVTSEGNFLTVNAKSTHKRSSLFCHEANFVKNFRTFEGKNFLAYNAVVEKITNIRYESQLFQFFLK